MHFTCKTDKIGQHRKSVAVFEHPPILAPEEATSMITSIPVESPRCSVEECVSVVRARGLCIKHYGEARRSGELDLILPRRKDNLCATCRTEPAMLPRSSYCRGCATTHERERRRENANEINARSRSRYSPDKNFAQKLKRYGLTLESYAAIAERQGGVCAICEEPGELHVDHDHECCPEKMRSCGKCIRGLLCSNCNNGLGRFKDSVRRLTRASEYLGTPGAVAWLESAAKEGA